MHVGGSGRKGRQVFGGCSCLVVKPLSGRGAARRIAQLSTKSPPRLRRTYEGCDPQTRSPGGAWIYQLDLGFDDAGKRRQRQVGKFATKREAQAALNEALAGLQKGTYVVTDAPSERMHHAVEGLRAGYSGL